MLEPEWVSVINFRFILPIPLPSAAAGGVTAHASMLLPAAQAYHHHHAQLQETLTTEHVPRAVTHGIGTDMSKHGVPMPMADVLPSQNRLN